ncbi:uncharacterized protein LOC113496085 [Trichoplusia ni]|uniref:Uncharacterized protein LOC113496085 n=1 Tax=Trichoplusia ni TaxID=7111 RepID=A0A7E5VRT6_TRINI|nr:uncharacterized protein LOC113496085 [Trichoplusia ni]
MPPKVIVLILVVGTVYAITWSSKLDKKPEEFAGKEGCYIKEINDVIPFNESINVKGYCYLIHCTKKIVHYVSCGAAPAEREYCLINEADLDRPYPGCCPLVRCFESEIEWLADNKTNSKHKA